METIKERDFVEIEYTGRLSDTKEVFDSTDEKTARDNGIFAQHMIYGPVTVCVGQKQVMFDSTLIGKQLGKSLHLEFPTEKAFGKKDAKLLKLVPTSVFKKDNITPGPGLRVNIDGMIGTIRTVTGGRTIVDFNHPLSGKDVEYDVKINKKVEGTTAKLKSFLIFETHLTDMEVKVKDGVAEVKLAHKIPEELSKKLEERCKEVISELKNIEFISKDSKNLNSSEN